jgi:hypothetical protein
MPSDKNYLAKVKKFLPLHSKPKMESTEKDKNR